MLRSLANKMRGLAAVWKFDNRWQLIASRLGLGRGCDVYVLHGMIILIDHDGGDASGTRECLTSDMYRRFFPHMKLGGELTILDLGANGGGFPLLLKSAGLSLRKIVCVEMNPNVFNRLRYNIESNFECARHCVNAAVGAENGERTLFLGQGDTGESVTLAQSPRPGSRRYSVPFRTFDGIYGECLSGDVTDICKIDIEGAERDLLRSQGHARLASCRYVIMEIHSGREERVELVQLMSDLGFEDITPLPSADAVHLFSNRRLTACVE